MKDEGNSSDEKEEVKESSSEAVEETKEKDSEQSSEVKGSDEEQASETKISDEETTLEEEQTSEMESSSAEDEEVVEVNEDLRETVATEWDFANAGDFAGTSPYNGLEFTNASHNQSKYLLAAADSTITVPVQDTSKAGKIVVKSCYGYEFNFENGKNIGSASGSTGNQDTFEYYYEAGTDQVVINVKKQSYFNSIKVDTENTTITETSEWDFTKYTDYDSSAVAQTTAIKEWNGLIISGGKYHGTSYGLVVTSGSVMIPVKGDCTITVDAGYEWNFGFFNIEDTDNSYHEDANAGYKTFTYEYVGDKGMVPIIAAKTPSTYIKKITVTYHNNTAVTGTLELPEGLTNPTLIFTCKESGAVTEATVSGTTVSATLKDGYAYTVSLKDSDGYNITSGAAFSINAGESSKTLEKIVISSSEEKTELKHYTLEAQQYIDDKFYEDNSNIDTTTANQYKFTNKETLAGKPDDFFTVHMAAGTRIDGGQNKSFTAGDIEGAADYKGTARLNFTSGTTSATSNAIQFTTVGKSALWVYWVEAGNKTDGTAAMRYLVIVDEQGNVVNDDKGQPCVAGDPDTLIQNGTCISSFGLPKAGTYSIVSAEKDTNGNYTNFKGNYIFKVEIATPVKVEGGTTSDCIEENTYDFAKSYSTTEAVEAIKGLSLSNITWYDSSHGLATAANGKMTLDLSKTAELTVTTCRYNSNASDIMETSSGTVTESSVDEGNPAASAPVFTVTGASGKTTLTFASGTYIHSLKVVYKEDESEEIENPDLESGDGKIDVWDFGAEQLDTTKYNNKLTKDIINGWYPSSVAAGTSGNDFPAAGFDIKDSDGKTDLKFNTAGATNHRLRTTNKELTRKDDKSLTYNGVTYTGYIYSNKAQSKDVNFELAVQTGDIVTLVVSSNDSESTIHFESPDGTDDKKVYKPNDKDNTAIMTFKAKGTGLAKFYSADEKLCVARIYRERPAIVNVTGSITVLNEGIPEGYLLSFENDETGTVIKANSGDSYEVKLQEQYTYTVGLIGADEYIVDKGNKLDLTEKTGQDRTNDIEIKSVDLVDVSGSIDGLDSGGLNKIEITLENTQKVYQPKLTIKNNGYTARFERGVTYTVKASDKEEQYAVEDYTLMTKTVSADADANDKNITFEKKALHKVTIEPEGDVQSLADIPDATYLFTYLDATKEGADKTTGYKYTFTDPEQISLRDGTYKVEVKNTGSYLQGITSDLKVEGADTTKTIKFVKEVRTEWDFTTDASLVGKENGVQIQKTTGIFHCLEIDATTGKFDSQNRTKDAQFNTGAKIKVPVTGASQVIISMYDTNYKVDGEPATEKITSANYTGSGAGYVEIEATGNTYLNSIEIIATSGEYKDTVTVGANKNYKTINEALDAISKMDRKADDGSTKRVTVEIDPGNYEEMLVIDQQNITFKNASASPSIALKNKGADIDDNAVRITWYYGHGYTYYSMGNDCKYDADVLEANKQNGYASYVNPGAGSTNGSYWNASVVISANGFEADGIIFENSFNQYISAKCAEDVLEKQSGAAKETGLTPRAELKTVGDTAVQNKGYVERATALAITNNIKQVSFNNCSFVGRQDVVYGGTGVTAAFYGCDVYGAVDYIFGGMTAVFAKCELILNTSDVSGDMAYITAPQQSSGRGYLMYNCHVTSIKPGIDSASTYPSKPSGLGRAWTANTGEAVFYMTVVDAADEHWADQGASLITPQGWYSGLSSGSSLCTEYGTIERAEGVDNSAKRDKTLGGGVLAEEKLADGSPITVETFLGSWNPFEGKNMTIVKPDDPEKPEESGSTPEGSETAPSESTPEGSETAPGESVPEGSETAPSENIPEGSETAPSESVPEGSETNPSESETEPGVPDDDKITSDVKNISISDTQRVSIKAANLVSTNKPQYAVIVTCTYIDKDGETDVHQLIEGVHYRVSLAKGSDGKSVGTQEIIISGTGVDTDFGRFIGKKTVSYEILSKTSANKNNNIARLKLRLNKTDVKNAVYTGKAITPRVEGLNGLDSDDYTFEYKNNVNAGKGSVIVLGTGDYYGRKELTFSIKKSDLSKIDVPTASNVDIKRVKAKNYVAEEKDDTSTELVYKGSPITLEDLTLAIDNVKLRWREDYTVTYKNNAKIGTATATIKGVNNLSGSIKITYAITRMDSDAINEVFEDTESNPIPAEYSSRGARLKTITIGDAVLTENKDYKVTYSKASKAKYIEIGEEFDVKVTGKGSYRNVFKNETVHIVTVPGNYYARANAVVDVSKLKGSKIKEMQTIINAARITDAAGVKVKANDLEDIEIIDNATIKVIPGDTEYYNETELACHVARKLSGVKTVGTGIVKYFDGANSVTLTTTEIAKTLQGVEDDDIRIVSYRNNNRIGTATVKIEGTPESIYYGTKTMKFKIKAYKDKPQFGPEGSASEESSTEESSGSTEESSGSTEESSTETGSTEESSEGASTEGSSVEESSTEESSSTEPENPEKPTETQEKTLWVVGDSTVSAFNDAYYYPRYGYGTQIENYETGYYKVENLAMSGRSSKSYLTDKDSKVLYEKLTAGIGAGDVLIIGFGHNDEKAEAERYTNPNGSYTTDGSFAKSLYDNYVKIALDAGATPIVCTPIVRRNASGTLSDADCHITKDATGYPGGNYPKAIRDLGAAVNVAVVDLTALTKDLYTELGADGTLKLHAWLSDKDTSVDNTHLNIYGAKKIAYMLAKEIQAKEIEGVSNHFWTGAEPTEANDLKPNPDYKPLEYDNNLKQSELWQDYGVFKGTVFGTTGTDMTFYSVGTDTDGSMRLKASGNKSKVASSEDGFAMYYYKVPVGQNFSISAKAKLNTIPTGADVNQVAFGLMARDDMYIDSAKGAQLTGAITSDYVVAGSLGADKNGNWTNCFKRKSGKLEKGSNLAAGKIVQGGTYDLNITSNSDGYAVTFDTEGTLTGGFDYQLTAVDSEYVYVGMFVSRNADVSFTDIKLIVDGKTIVGEDTPGGDDDKDLAKYNMEGFAVTANVTGGGTLKDGDEGYYKVDTVEQFLIALQNARTRSGENKSTVIEITADELKFGDKENQTLGIVAGSSGTYSGVIRAYGTGQEPIMHPTLKETGVSQLKMHGFKNVTIFSRNGARIKHASTLIEGDSQNIIIRNLIFDELWEWDDSMASATKGGEYDRNDWDYITVDDGSDGVWIDHCTFYKAYDGIIDVKRGKGKSQRVTVSWCQFLPGFEDNTFFDVQMAELEKNKDSLDSATSYYKYLIDKGHSLDLIKTYASTQKKTHLFGFSDDDKKDIAAAEIRVTLANNYYKNSMDRLPRLRRGIAHEYNCILDSSEVYTADPTGKLVTSNGSISTCNGQMLLENCYINGIRRPLMSGNSSSPRGYTGAVNSVWYLGNTKKDLVPTSNVKDDAGNTLPALTLDADEFKANLPYKDNYTTYDAESLKTVVMPNAGAGKLTLTAEQWVKTQY